MSKQRDDTPETEDAPPVAGDKKSKSSYYYDDATGYEIYDPTKEDNGEQEETDECEPMND
jgi:hypothetical protein